MEDQSWNPRLSASTICHKSKSYVKKNLKYNIHLSNNNNKNYVNNRIYVKGRGKFIISNNWKFFAIKTNENWALILDILFPNLNNLKIDFGKNDYSPMTTSLNNSCIRFTNNNNYK
jgi:hypothetical protein